MNSYLAVMHEIHVLFVDHELNCLNTTRLLETCQYRVTHVAVAADAMLMLSNGKLKFDFVIANINSPDLQGFKLLQVAVSMEIPIILMSVDDDTITAMRVIEIGAFLYIKRPTTLEMLRCLWQHVAREKARVMREANYVHENPNNLEKGKLRRNYYSYKGRQVVEDADNSMAPHAHGKVKRKICTEWTQELHDKFMDAVQQLGEGRCFPKEILELMNVPGLTRMQVASHLQKCRNDNWRSPDERKSSYPMMLSDGEGSQHKARRFGSMPRVEKDEQGVYSQGSMGAETLVMPNQITYHHDHDQHYGALVPHPDNTSRTAQGFYSLDTDCLIQNLSDLPHGFTTITSRPLPFDSVYQQKAPSMDSGSQWTGSENSNFCSDDSQPKPN